MSSSKSMWLTFVALADEKIPAPEPLLEVFHQLGRDEPLPTVASRTPGMVTLAWGHVTAGYTLVPRAIPDSQLVGPCETAWYWPQAAQALSQHPAHLLVTLVDEGRDPLAKAMRLTAITVAVAQASESVGILWAPAGLIHEPAAFAEQACQMSPQNLPLFLWIAFRVEAQADGLLRLFTTGLEAFDRRDLEVIDYAGDVQQLLDDIYNVAHYMLSQPSAIKDDDTIGLPDGRQARAKHEPSPLGDEHRVIRLELD